MPTYKSIAYSCVPNRAPGPLYQLGLSHSPAQLVLFGFYQMLSQFYFPAQKKCSIFERFCLYFEDDISNLHSNIYIRVPHIRFGFFIFEHDYIHPPSPPPPFSPKKETIKFCTQCLAIQFIFLFFYS